MQPVQITLPQGVAQGFVQDGVQRYYSLPYAAPMTAERRFRAPEPAPPWPGVRDATRPGPRAPQSPTPPMAGVDVEALMGPPGPEGGDYLTLNLFAPESAEGERADAAAPVMVFIHGGSFVAGSKDAPIHDGAAFARDGVVCVVINYPLGIEGFLPIEGVPTNLGLRDMIAALHWVRANIALVGGDPANVTLFGESGGAFCTAALMVSPLARGLFHRAICQSGHILLSRDREVMERVLKSLARRLRIKPTRAGFLGVAVDRMLAAQAWVMRPSLWLDMRDSQGRDPSFGITRFMPAHGDDVLPEPMIEALRRGAGGEIDLLIGTTREEANLFFVPDRIRDRLNRWTVLFFVGQALPRARAALRAYGLGRKGEKPGHVMTRAITDLMFRWMARRTAELHHGRSWVYEFDWRSPALDGQLGAAHAVELPFVFDTLACASGERGLLGPAPPQALADRIHRIWTRFAADGTAPWPTYDSATRQVYSLERGAAEHEPVMPAAAFLP
jgi:para-nitrobenzyl esterase